MAMVVTKGLMNYKSGTYFVKGLPYINDNLGYHAIVAVGYKVLTDGRVAVLC